MESFKNFYQDLGKTIDVLVENPFTVLLTIGFLILFTTVMLMITRHNYTRIVRMIDRGEEEAIEKRIEEWGEMIINNVQQECMERKLSLTTYIFILPVVSLLMIIFSIYKLDMVTNLILTAIHLLILTIIIFIVRYFRRKRSGKRKSPVQSNALNKKVDIDD